MDALNTSIAAGAIAVVLISLKLLDRFVLRKNGVDQRPVVQKCPNKIETIAATLSSLERHCGLTAEAAASSRTGVELLVKQHAAGPNGIEHWKIPAQLVENSSQLLVEQAKMLAEQERTSSFVEKMVELQKETVTILKRNERQ